MVIYMQYLCICNIYVIFFLILRFDDDIRLHLALNHLQKGWHKLTNVVRVLQSYQSCLRGSQRLNRKVTYLLGRTQGFHTYRIRHVSRAFRN